MARKTERFDIVWITGASSGIGRATALLLARQGATVAASARRVEELELLVREAADLPGKIFAYPVDVTNADEVASVFGRITADVGVPDAALLNAGIGEQTSAKKIDPTSFARIMEVNYMGTVNCLSPLVGAMLTAGHGTIGIVASLAGYRGLPGGGAYSASKAALISLAESLAGELGPHGIAIKVINPGYIRTAMTAKNRRKMPFLMEVDAAAKRIVAGLYSGRFETTFPRRLSWIAKVIQRLPNAAYLWLMRSMARQRPSAQ